MFFTEERWDKTGWHAWCVVDSETDYAYPFGSKQSCDDILKNPDYIGRYGWVNATFRYDPKDTDAENYSKLLYARKLLHENRHTVLCKEGSKEGRMFREDDE